MTRTKAKPILLPTRKLRSGKRNSEAKITSTASGRPKRTIYIRKYDGLTNPKLFQFLQPDKTISQKISILPVERPKRVIHTKKYNELANPKSFQLLHPDKTLCLPRPPKIWKLIDFINLKNIGSGGFGQVYQAFAKPLQVDVALKFINLETAKIKQVLPSDIQTEYEIHKKISHKNICRVLGEFKLTADHVFVLELCTNGDLHDYIYNTDGEETGHRCFPRNLTRSIRYLNQIISAVLHIQLKIGYIHMDVKPENVLLASTDVVKVTDFGHAVKFNSFRFIHEHYEARGGTFYYQPPELLRKFGFDSTADVWAIGCIAFELLMLKHPFFLDVSHMDYRSPSQNLQRGLRIMKLMQDKQFLFSLWTELSEEQITFFRQIFGKARAKRPLIRDLDNLGWINSYRF